MLTDIEGAGRSLCEEIGTHPMTLNADGVRAALRIAYRKQATLTAAIVRAERALAESSPEVRNARSGRSKSRAKQGE